MFTKDFQVKLIDFGLSQKYYPYDDTMKSTDFRGTDPFIAPETYFFKYDKFSNTIRSDVFALGVLLM
jgi:serine/threonine protein kinase